MQSSVSLATDAAGVATATERAALRSRLLAARNAHAAGEAASAAAPAMALHLHRVVAELSPDCLGLYSPVRSEFNALAVFAADTVAKALPYTQKRPPMLRYRRWDGVAALVDRDDANIPVSAGAEVVPDVVLVPCVGYTRQNYRLGYGGGYFDRFMAAHPHVTAVGVAWSFQVLDDAEFAPEPHDRPLVCVVTERGVQ